MSSEVWATESDVVAAQPIVRYLVRIRFGDGLQGVLDFEPLLHGPIFDEVRPEHEFAKLAVDEELGTVTWPNGADIAPETLRHELVRNLRNRSQRERRDTAKARAAMFAAERSMRLAMRQVEHTGKTNRKIAVIVAGNKLSKVAFDRKPVVRQSKKVDLVPAVPRSTHSNIRS